jgi:signal transduction histidine kinase/ligand-binding sensor domain-containing protein
MAIDPTDHVRRACQTLATVLIGVLCHAQLALSSPTLSQMYHTGWTVREGAPRAINEIAQTKDGFLWLSTDDGLFRFDGQSFDRYQPASGDSFPAAQTNALLPTPDGGLWIGYFRVGASFLKQGRNINYGERAGMDRATVFSFSIDIENTVWAGSSSGLKRLEGSSWKTVGKEWNFPANVAVGASFVDNGGTLWVGTSVGILYLRKAEHAFRSVADVLGPIYGIVQAPNGTLWIRSSTGLVRALDPSSATLRRDIPPIGVRARAIGSARDGSLWIMTDKQGVFRIESPEKPLDSSGPLGANTQHFGQQDGLTGNFSFMVAEDREGSTWVATTKGLDQFRPTALTALNLPEGVAQPSVAVAGPQRVFLGAAIVEVPSGRVVAPAPASLPNITATYRDPSGTLWFGGGEGGEGLWRYVDGQFTSYPLPDNLGVEHQIQAIAMDRAGGLWVSFVRLGVYRLFRRSWSHVINLLAAPDNLATAITVDSRGCIWFAYGKSNRIQVLDGGKLTTFRESDGLDLGYAMTVTEINGQIVIGGETGLEILKGNKFRHLRLLNDAPLSLVTGVLQQQNGDVWVNQGSGILRIDASEIRKAQSDPNIQMRFTLFDYLDGVADLSAPIRPRPTIVDGGDGYLYFAMRTSVLFMDTAHPPRNLLKPAVVIHSLSDGSKEYLNPIDAVLPPNTDKVTIRYTASSLLIPQRVRFRYRLEGIDDTWQQGNGERQAAFSRLPPGHYVFHVAASNNDGIWNENGNAVRFTIPPSFIQSLGFKTLCAAGALALLWLAYRIRLRQITAHVRRRLYERLEERTRIARDLHDTFFQGIQGLLLRFNTGTALLQRDEPARAIFEEALEQSDRVMLEGRELMLDLRAGSSSTAELADALALAGNDMKKTYPGDFRVTVIGEPRPLHPIVFDEVHRLGREALSNAFRHAHAKSIEAELNYERNQFRVRIRDDGIGIAAEVLSPGFRAGHWGLPGMRERAEKIGGHVDIWSRPGAGTEIELRVPAAAAYVPKLKRSRFGWLRAVTTDSEDAYE